MALLFFEIRKFFFLVCSQFSWHIPIPIAWQVCKIVSFNDLYLRHNLMTLLYHSRISVCMYTAFYSDKFAFRIAACCVTLRGKGSNALAFVSNMCANRW